MRPWPSWSGLEADSRDRARKALQHLARTPKTSPRDGCISEDARPRIAALRLEEHLPKNLCAIAPLERSAPAGTSLWDYAYMTTGTVKFFDTIKEFGLITPDDGGKDVFVHITEVDRAMMTSLTEGQKVSFEVQQDTRGPKAVDLAPVEEAAPEEVAVEEVAAEEAPEEVAAEEAAPEAGAPEAGAPEAAAPRRQILKRPAAEE